MPTPSTALFWDLAYARPETLGEAYTITTPARAAVEPIVLATQDTTAHAVTAHRATSGVGPLAHPSRRGPLVHSVQRA